MPTRADAAMWTGVENKIPSRPDLLMAASAMPNTRPATAPRRTAAVLVSSVHGADHTR
jgi:hypothetical protein